jgi:pimeloyl-ACP methyl ester carboxylesterase
MTLIYLHGLDSSGSGTKGRFFAAQFPTMLRPDFAGNLAERMAMLDEVIADASSLIVVGSSFGGLMGAMLAAARPERVKRLIMLAPALNFPDYAVPPVPLPTSATLVIGRDDLVTPPDLVIPAARASFADLTIELVDDDHLLHNTFTTLNWPALLSQ